MGASEEWRIANPEGFLINILSTVSRCTERHQLLELLPKKLLQITSIRTDSLAIGVTEADRSISF